MVDIWMIFNPMIPFFEILLLTYIDNLRPEKDGRGQFRAINHHGEKRNIETEINVFSVEPIEVKSEGEQLFSKRDEVTQDKALTKFDQFAKITDEIKLKYATRFVHVFIPLCAIIFTTIYWLFGLAHAEFF